MTTAAQVITQILNEINVRASESALEADEVQDAIFALNSYMASIAADGINLGYTEVENLGDPITVPSGAIMGMVANAAIMLAPTFDADVSQALVLKARQGLSAMRKLGVSISSMNYPDTLPVGSGNERDWDDDHFYHQDDPTIATEGGAGGSVGLEQKT